jgi:hypothetical protein
VHGRGGRTQGLSPFRCVRPTLSRIQRGYWFQALDQPAMRTDAFDFEHVADDLPAVALGRTRPRECARCTRTRHVASRVA